MKKIAFALLAVSLAGCAARGPAFTEAPPPGTKALVYIYRPYNQWISTQDAGFDANGKRVGFLDPGGYTYFHAPAGHYDIRQFWPLGLWTIQAPGLWKDLHVSADLNGGETHYFRLRVQQVSTGECSAPSAGMSWCIGWDLAEVPPEVGRREIAEQKFEPQNKAMPAEYKP